MKQFKNGARLGLGILVLSAAAFAFAACGGGDDSSSASGTEQASGKKLRIGAMMSAFSGYESAVVKGAEAAAAEHDGTVTAFTANYDPAKQLQQCQDAIASGEFDGLIFYPLSGAVLVPCVAEAAEAGVAITSIDTPLGADYTSTEIQLPGVTNQVIQPITKDGEAAARMVVDACADKNPCEVAYLLGEPSFAYSAERQKVVKEVLEDHPQIEIVAEGKAGLGTPDVAHTAAENVLQANPEVDVIVNDDDPSMAGIEKAVKEAGLTDQIELIAGGGSRGGYDAVKNGRWFGTVAYLPVTGAEKAVNVMIESIEGKEPEDVNVQLSEISSFGDIALTQETIEQFEPEWDATDAG